VPRDDAAVIAHDCVISPTGCTCDALGLWYLRMNFDRTLSRLNVFEYDQCFILIAETSSQSTCPCTQAKADSRLLGLLLAIYEKVRPYINYIVVCNFNCVC
jgi:hypothetical protein